MTTKTKEGITLSIKVSLEEMARVDLTWRSNPTYKNRTAYIRDKLGLKQENGV